jgi:hypothetical protein
MKARFLASFSGVGLFAGAGAWALHQQAGINLASWSCAHASQGVWTSGAVAALLLLLGAGLSWTAVLALRSTAPADGHPRRMIALVALMASALFLFAIALQVSAALFLPGCAG